MRRLFVVAATVLLFVGVGYAAKGAKHTVDAKTCIGCTLCVQSCPAKAIAMKNGKAVIDPEKCVNCGLCAQKCPVKAIHGPAQHAAEKKNEIENEIPKKLFYIQMSRCTGCRECVPRCPTKAIAVVMGKAVIDPEKCVDCGVCAKTCAFGAPVEREAKR